MAVISSRRPRLASGSFLAANIQFHFFAVKQGKLRMGMEHVILERCGNT
jgi:hypothetical protein